MIYADYNATTPCLPKVAAIIQQVLCTDFGNPSARHSLLGRTAQAHIDTAREHITTSIGAFTDEIIFTSGATEACNQAIFGCMERLLGQRPHMCFAATEHSAVRKPIERCQQAGAQVTTLPVLPNGLIDTDLLATQVNEQTALVAIMLANNETGIIQDLPTITEIAHKHGALVFCDCTQALGKIPVDLHELDCDFAAFSAHKCYGPKGVGCLYKKRGLAINPLIHGGGQEAGLRSGTENVAGIAGFGAAVAAIQTNFSHRHSHLLQLSTLLETRLQAALPDLRIHGADIARIPGTSMLTIPGLHRGWLNQLKNIVASNGSACSSGTGELSYGLQALGLSEQDAANSVRISLGIHSTTEEVEQISAALITGAEKLR